MGRQLVVLSFACQFILIIEHKWQMIRNQFSLFMQQCYADKWRKLSHILWENISHLHLSNGSVSKICSRLIQILYDLIQNTELLSFAIISAPVQWLQFLSTTRFFVRFLYFDKTDKLWKTFRLITCYLVFIFLFLTYDFRKFYHAVGTLQTFRNFIECHCFIWFLCLTSLFYFLLIFFFFISKYSAIQCEGVKNGIKTF